MATLISSEEVEDYVAGRFGIGRSAAWDLLDKYAPMPLAEEYNGIVVYKLEEIMEVCEVAEESRLLRFREGEL